MNTSRSNGAPTRAGYALAALRVAFAWESVGDIGDTYYHHEVARLMRCATTRRPI